VWYNEITARGPVTLHRRYRCCPHCQYKFFPADVALGLEADYTNGLNRLATRCCGNWSYRLAAENLLEFCGVQLSHATLGKIADRTAVKIAAQLQDNPDIRNDFQKAKGAVEFYSDGTFVHIRNEEGKAEWREVKVGALVKREQGESASPSEWATRKLPEPTVVSAFAAIEAKEEFQERCQAERRHLGVGGVSSALGDGALWIWSLTFAVFGSTRECLDIYHALEHVAACGKALYGNGKVFTDWLDRMRLVLLSEGFPGMDREWSAVLSDERDEEKRKAVISLIEYLRKNSDRLHYAERLSEGRAIGSGLIEGACKNLIGRRLKQTGACWRVDRANRIALICSVLYSKQWKRCWEKTA
jgi:hypothetical protein